MSLWDHVFTETELNLKTLGGFVQGVADLISHSSVDFEAQQFLLPRNPIEATFSIHLGLSQSVLKVEDNDKVLKLRAFETINILSLTSHLLRLFMDGSRSNDYVTIEVSVYCYPCLILLPCWVSRVSFRR
ncbi:hypothetical protein CEXT_579141 [Caerostris extrusa]|uniref:Uncharacterized protein n=1 Tax=Caerostris extrusa TaxID=172846 RepID=A0AAV4UDL8_CAEEX|nr:hypothetical protein CEXT_579141 [Caerostris extrusa]